MTRNSPKMNRPVMRPRRRAKAKVHYKMAGTLISSNADVEWTVPKEPDLAGLRSGHKPADLTNVRIVSRDVAALPPRPA